MLANLNCHVDQPSDAALEKYSHILCVIPQAAKLDPQTPAREVVRKLLTRRRMKADELGKTGVAGNLPHGGVASWVMLDPHKSEFESQSAVRSALQALLAENPDELAIIVIGDGGQRQRAAEVALYCAWINGIALPVRKTKPERRPLKTIHLHGCTKPSDLASARARALGNVLCRELTVLPPNELTPTTYRARLKNLARRQRWRYRELDFATLRRMKAGAFCAVAQGSAQRDAAIVHLTYASARPLRRIAVVGKGICFDTGGHNLKPARSMYSMHEDMNGSAVALGILLAAAELKLPFTLDCWLAVAQNHLSPSAYKQNDVVTALNGTTIEVTHTDAEGRMVLADTLTLAARDKPDLILDFATLTGSMHSALGERYSGIFATSELLAMKAVSAGKRCGERVCVFPMDADYESALDSAVADIKQCTLEGAADHILATRFLKRFVGELPWIHVDLSASNCKGGLGAVASDVTGFGVSWGVSLLDRLLDSASETG